MRGIKEGVHTLLAGRHRDLGAPSKDRNRSAKIRAPSSEEAHRCRVLEHKKKFTRDLDKKETGFSGAGTVFPFMEDGLARGATRILGMGWRAVRSLSLLHLPRGSESRTEE